MKRPHRVVLSRAKGWRMPPNTVKVDRSTKWGNPFQVGVYGTAQQCVDAFRLLLGGCVSLGQDELTIAYQRAYQDIFRTHWRQLRGKNLGCWCPKGQPCHADVLLWAVRKLVKAGLR